MLRGAPRWENCFYVEGDVSCIGRPEIGRSMRVSGCSRQLARKAEFKLTTVDTDYPRPVTGRSTRRSARQSRKRIGTDIVDAEALKGQNAMSENQGTD